MSDASSLGMSPTALHYQKDAANFKNISNTLRHNNDFVKKILKGYCVSMLRTRCKEEYM
jgi:hypothetical protein